jgi:hypothetical protein
VLSMSSVRAYGELSLGNNVHDFDELTARRQGIFDDFMKEAKKDPTRFSPVVPYETPSAAIIGRVFELRWLCDEVDANEVKTGKTFIHCFSGTITAFYPATNTSATKGECGKSKHAAVRVKWDRYFEVHYGWVDSDHLLNPALCQNEKKQNGWNLLSREYQQWKEQADKDEGDLADDESDSDVGSDDGQMAA